jgi:hypothetical protein
MPKKVTEAQITSYLQTLRETPQRIATATAGIDETRLKKAPPQEWSLVKIMGHLRAGAEVWSNSIYAMLTHDNPQMDFIHPREWDKKQGYGKGSFGENLQAFTVERQKLLPILETLPFEAWGRTGHFIGKVNTYSVFGEAMRMALHESDHWGQIDKTVLLI